MTIRARVARAAHAAAARDAYWRAATPSTRAAGDAAVAAATAVATALEKPPPRWRAAGGGEAAAAADDRVLRGPRIRLIRSEKDVGALEERVARRVRHLEGDGRVRATRQQKHWMIGRGSAVAVILLQSDDRRLDGGGLRDGARRANRIGRSSHRVCIEIAAAGDRYGLGLIAAQRKAVREWQRPIAFARFGEEARCDIY